MSVVRPVRIDSLLGFVHEPATGTARRGTAVLFCSPFGWEEVCSYRSRYDWAQELAGQGYPALRFDLPGSGDSPGSARDPDRLEAWTAATAWAADELRRRSGASLVVAIGIGLGGLLALRAGERTKIDSYVLWSVPARGRGIARELRMFARLEAEDHQPADAGFIQVGGFSVAEETLEALSKIEVPSLDPPAVNGARVLVLGRDEMDPDARLIERLTAAGAQVTTAPGTGYGEMMLEPHEAHSPRAAFATVSGWLAGEEVLETTGGAAEARGDEGVLDEGTWRESVLTVEQPFGRLVGVLTEPAGERRGDICALFLNAGAVRRIGPNRMWVRAARRWAASGVPSLRLDLEGIGDAGGQLEPVARLGSLYTPRFVQQALAAMDELETRGLGPRFLLSGLCSGAYWSVHAAARDDRVAAAFLLNPQVLVWDESAWEQRQRRESAGGALRPSAWRELPKRFPRPSRILEIVRSLVGLIGHRMADAARSITKGRSRPRGDVRDEQDLLLDRAAANGCRLVFAFSGLEPLHEELARAGRLDALAARPNVVLESLPGRDHTLRPPEARQAAHDLMDRELEALLTAG